MRPTEIENMIESIAFVQLCLVVASPTRADVVVILSTKQSNNDTQTKRAQQAKLEAALQEALDNHDYSSAEACWGELQEMNASSPQTGDATVKFSVSSADATVKHEIEQTSEWGEILSKFGNLDFTLLTTPNEWSIANGMLSGELKKRRGVLLAAYEPLL